MNEIVKHEVSLDELQRMAKLLAVSGYFDAKGDSAQAIAQICTKILAGRELGYGPFSSVQGIHIIQGRPALSANIMAAAVKNSPRYDYRVRKLDTNECAIEFLERMGDGKRESLGVSVFTREDAVKAQVKNTDKYARNMLFARAMSNGVRWYCPDVFSGNTVYTPEELGASTDDNGVIVVDGSTGEVLEDSPPASGIHTDDDPSRYPESLDDVPEIAPAPPKATTNGGATHRKLGQIDEKQLNTLHALGNALCAGGAKEWDTKRHEMVSKVTKGRTSSAVELTVAEATVMQKALEDKTREYYRQTAEGWENPFDLKNIDDLHGVELANAYKELKKLVAAPKAAQDKRNVIAAIRN